MFGAGPAVMLHDSDPGLFLNFVSHRVIKFPDGNHGRIAALPGSPEFEIVDFFGFTRQVDTGNIDFTAFRLMVSGYDCPAIVLFAKTRKIPRRRVPAADSTA